MAASQTRRASFFLQAHSDDGMWRSPVAQRSGGPEVASSNLVIPTSIEGNGNIFISFFLCSVVLPAVQDLRRTSCHPDKKNNHLFFQVVISFPVVSC